MKFYCFPSLTFFCYFYPTRIVMPISNIVYLNEIYFIIKGVKPNENKLECSIVGFRGHFYRDNV